MNSLQKKLLKHKISAISGWIDLKDIPSAQWEAAQLSSEEKKQQESIEMLYELSRLVQDWDQCLHYGSLLTEITPHDAGTWVRYCNALFWNEQVEEACDLAQEKMNEFPKVWDLVYNLACYHTRHQDYESALQALRKAAQIANDLDYFEHQAKIDPDLEPLWKHLGKKADEFFSSGDLTRE